MSGGKEEVESEELTVQVYWEDGLHDLNIIFEGNSEMSDKQCVQSTALMLHLLMKTTDKSTITIDGSVEVPNVCDIFYNIKYIFKNSVYTETAMIHLFVISEQMMKDP